MVSLFTLVCIVLFGVIFAALAAYWGAKNGHGTNSRVKNQYYRNAILDKRLSVHQKAFLYSLRLPDAAHNPKHNTDFLHKCDQFWKTNCLFMLPSVRESFRIAYHTAWFYSSYKDSYEKGEVTEKKLSEEWNKITKVTHEIVESVGFKWLGNLEPISKEHNYLRRSSDWQNPKVDRRRNSNSKTGRQAG
jgi:hypothetical protein